MNEYIKRNEESITSYWIRLYKNRQAYGLTFAECGALMNEVSGTDWNEAKWRREMEGYLKVSEYLSEENPTGLSSLELQELQDEKLEMQKEKIRMRDQKRLMNTKLRELARLEHLENYLEDTVEAIEPIKFPKLKAKEQGDKEAMVIISDAHVGMKIDSKFNTYNTTIAQERLDSLQEEVFSKVKKENIQKLYITNLGDAIHGHINVTGRIESEENSIEQTVLFCNMLEKFIEPFLQEGIDVTFTNIAGNHSRLLSNKKESLGTAENFERLFTVFLGKAFSKFDNYSQIDDEEGIVELDIKGKKIVQVHADLDKGAGVVTKLNDMLGTSIDYLFTGHVHNHFVKEHGNAIQYGVGSLAGLDSYAISSRFSGRASQLYLTFDENGVDDMKAIYFN